MTTVARIKVRWEGFFGAPGLSTFYCLDAATWRPNLLTFFNTIKARMPTTVVMVVEAQGDLVNDVTGDITGSWTEGAETSYTGAITGNYPAPSGVVVNWLTTAVIAGRRLRGKTFLVPIGGAGYDNNGTIISTYLTDFRAAATALHTTTPGQMLVLHRPTLAGSPAGVTAGSSSAVTTATVPDLAAVLRSRRG